MVCFGDRSGGGGASSGCSGGGCGGGGGGGGGSDEGGDEGDVTEKDVGWMRQRWIIWRSDGDLEMSNGKEKWIAKLKAKRAKNGQRLRLWNTQPKMVMPVKLVGSYRDGSGGGGGGGSDGDVYEGGRGRGGRNVTSLENETWRRRLEND